MKIGLTDVDGHKFPNILLIKLSAWHKQREGGGQRVMVSTIIYRSHGQSIYVKGIQLYAR